MELLRTENILTDHVIKQRKKILFYELKEELSHESYND